MHFAELMIPKIAGEIHTLIRSQCLMLGCERNPFDQRWATATLLIASLPLQLLVKFNSGATAAVPE